MPQCTLRELRRPYFSGKQIRAQGSDSARRLGEPADRGALQPQVLVLGGYEFERFPLLPRIGGEVSARLAHRPLYHLDAEGDFGVAYFGVAAAGGGIFGKGEREVRRALDSPEVEPALRRELFGVRGGGEKNILW